MSGRAWLLFGSVPVGAAAAAMDDVVAGLPAHDDDEAVPWLHCPAIDDGDSDTAPLPPEYCAGLLSGYSGLPAVPPAAAATAGIERLSRAVLPEIAAKPPQPSVGGGGEGVMNFTFFSRPLQRQQQASAAAAAASNHVESTVVETAANRLRNTPLFSDQRMAWLQPPPKAPRSTAVAPPPPQAAPPAPDHGHRAEPAATVTQHRLQPEARAPDWAAAVTTSSVCSGNGDRSQVPKRSTHQPAECSFSPDEDFDDEAGAMRRSSAARGTKRGRTAEVHNLSERRRRDRINEKMRALQELIPNCNKIDKASMLEEAIEYLKTLQLQVQMMWVGTGLCVPPMLLPAMMQRLQMAHFPHHLGMGLGLGMGAAAFDMVPIQRLAGGAQFPCYAMPPGASPMPMMPPGAMFGVPGQAMPSPAAFHHMAMASAAPAEQMEAAARGGGNQPAPIVPQVDAHQKLQQPKQT